LLDADNDFVNPSVDWQLMLACPCDSVVWRGCNCRLSDSWALDLIWYYIGDDARHDRVHGLVIKEENEEIPLPQVWPNLPCGDGFSTDHG